MTHYDTLSFLLLTGLVLFILLAVFGAYRKGCRDTWRAADEMTQIEPLVPPTTEPQPIVLSGSNPLTWNKLVANCHECQQDLDEQEEWQQL